MKKQLTKRPRRRLALWSAAILAAALLTGCGDGNGKEQPEQPNQSQPADSNGETANDPLSQFPAVKLPYQAEPETVIAEYQGGTLTAKELESFLRTITFFQPPQGPMIEASDEAALTNYIREYTGTKILAGRADEEMKKEAKSQADTVFEGIKQQYISLLNNDKANFDKLLKNQQITEEELKNQMTLMNQSILVLEKSVGEADLKQKYDQTDKSAFTTASVRHILISTENRSQEEAQKLANDLAARLKKGEDFAKLAKEYSDDPGSKEKGGLYENANVNDWVPEFKEAALTLPIGQISEPVKTNYGYHVMKVENRAVASFDEVKESLRQTAVQEKFGEFITKELDKLVTKWNIPKVG